jgi:hypothetical protein
MKRRWVGITAVLVACVALTLTLIAIYAIPAPLPPPSPQLQTQFSVTINQLKLGWRSRSQPVQPIPPTSPPPYFTRERVERWGLVTAMIAVAIAVAGWVRREGFWLSFLACNLAAAAIAWHVFVVTLFVLGWSGLIFVFPISGRTKPQQPAT